MQPMEKFIRVFMRNGARGRAERIVRSAVASAHRRLRGSIKSAILSVAFRNVRPQIELKRRRVGGIAYAVPVRVSPERGEVLAMRWLIQEARAARGGTMAARLAIVLVKAYEGRT